MNLIKNPYSQFSMEVNIFKIDRFAINLEKLRKTFPIVLTFISHSVSIVIE